MAIPKLPNNTFSLGGGSTYYGDGEDLSTLVIGGDDTFNGSSNTFGYTAYGDAESMWGEARGGNDTFNGGSNVGEPSSSFDPYAYDDESVARFIGDAGYMTDSTRGGHDTMIGGINSGNVFVGDAHEASGSVVGGNDTLKGGGSWATGEDEASENYLVGDAYSMGGGILIPLVSVDEGGELTGGADSMTGGGALSDTGTASTLNQMFGDGYSVMDATGGNDVMAGGAALTRGTGASSVFNSIAGDGYDLGFSTGGADRIMGGSAGVTADGTGTATTINTLLGDGYIMGFAVGGNDTVTGGSVMPGDADGSAVVINLLSGDALLADDYVMFGSDMLVGGSVPLGTPGAVTNTMYGDAFVRGDFGPGPDLIDIEVDVESDVGFGRDTLIGGSGMTTTNYMVGDANVLWEGEVGGNDRLVGGGKGATSTMIGDAETMGEGAEGGRDILVSGKGNDVMYGDAISTAGAGGADLFIFNRENGNDVINDFRASDGDKIDLRGLTFHPHFTNFAKMVAKGRLEDTEEGVVLHLDLKSATSDKHTVLLVGLDADDLSAGNFIF